MVPTELMTFSETITGSAGKLLQPVRPEVTITVTLSPPLMVIP